ncbi:GTP 3',8-cyclase MoaA [Cellulosilyticum sp. I15G10I2]|uniref:GTP 3',8-cyclase MoaA n=1 Tax=Cellulosilyticum sp. I15G10I2 TaxID=1892843 RepID=UPI00085CC6C6|nr:GTP 3',8-cyclase MoaA [Cellulosilyticum sp. I15G10I2]
MMDSYGRDISYLRVSITENCNLNCKYCMPDKKSAGCIEKTLSLNETYQIIKTFHKLGITKLRITGGEPLIRKGVIPFIEKVTKLEHLKDIAMTTNAVLLEEKAEALADAGLKRVNVSLDTLDAKKYHLITGGGDIQKVLRGIEAAKAKGLSPIKVNTVLIKGFNEDEIEAFAKWSDASGVEVRFIELMPIGEGINWSREKYISADQILENMPKLQRLEHTKGGTAVPYTLKGTQAKIGFITPMSCKFCNACNRMRLTSEGKLKGCLHSDIEIDLKTALRMHKPIEPIIMNAIRLKQQTHHLEEQCYTHKGMYQIGG